MRQLEIEAPNLQARLSPAMKSALQEHPVGRVNTIFVDAGIPETLKSDLEVRSIVRAFVVIMCQANLIPKRSLVTGQQQGRAKDLENRLAKFILEMNYSTLNLYWETIYPSEMIFPSHVKTG